jgi:predicted ATP-grasp superfamily ATP-dependent carboligase
MTEMPTVISSPAPAVTNPAHGREDYDVLVLEAGNRQSLASVRSFGRAGLRVALAESYAECDPGLPVLGFRSRYSARNVVLPNYAIDGSAFGTAVIEFVRANPTKVVLPTTDGAIAAMIPQRERLAELGCALALAPDPVLEVANDKDRTLAVARDLGIEVPATIRLDGVADVADLAATFAFPVVLKPTSSWVSRSPVRLQAVEAVNGAEAARIVDHYVNAGAGVLAQPWLGGRREGVMMFVVDGDVRAHCTHVVHRSSPALGGASVLRETVPTPPDVYEKSAHLVKVMGLEGLCEVEYRRDSAGRPQLMEVNARIVGNIESAVRAGIDFPLMIWLWATGQQIDPVAGYRTGVRTRWLRGDMRWLRDNFRRIGRPDSVSRTRALWMFGSEFARTRYYDSLDSRDIRPFLAELRTAAAAVRHSRRSVPTVRNGDRKEN